jgi:epoxyqueuosine reductase
VDIVSSLSERARLLGFAAIGFLKPGTPPHYDRFLAWLSRRKHGGLAWMEKNTDLREHPGRLLEGCRVIISLAYPYPVHAAATPEGLTVARYADPSREDYHLRLKRLCGGLVAHLREAFPDSLSRVLVDSAPILERSIAHAAGLGFVGKNNLLIVPGHGSFLYLCEILTTAALQFTTAETVDCLCGTCSRCLEACPTGALEEPFTLNAARCLAYLTVEHRGELEKDSGAKMKGCFLGCDRCQEACPFNPPAVAGEVSLPPAEEVLAMDRKEFKKRFGNTALARPGMERLKRNLLAIQAWS